MVKVKPIILIIDDEEVILDSYRMILENENYQLITVSDVEFDLRLLNEVEPDLVFVDLMMPGVSGFELIKKIHEIDSSIVTIAISDLPTVSSAVESIKCGAYDFMPKPFSPDHKKRFR